MSIRLSDNIIINDNPNVLMEDISSPGTDRNAVASFTTGTTIAYAQVPSIRVPNMTTRRAFESTDAETGILFFEDADSLMLSLED